jgi:hypothetical protein
MSQFKSRVNQPTRLFISSSDDYNQSNTAGFSQFTARFLTPVLNPTKTQLLRATIPNATVNLPDYGLCFWYYRLPTATTAPSVVYLYNVRLYPSSFVPYAGYTTYSKNRYFSDPNDFVSALNTAAAAGGDNATLNPWWSAGDISFSYNSTTKQISFTGSGSAVYYCNAGWNDPNVLLAQAGGVPTGIIRVPQYTSSPTTNYYPQSFIPQYTLNLRVGYAMSGQTIFNPAQTIGTSAVGAYANITNTTIASGTAVPPDSFPNLVYTGSITFLSDIVAGSSIGSNKQQNLLAIIPNNSAQLGVIQYVAATLTWLDKIPQTIYECNVQMFDENGQPYVLPDNAVVNVELGFAYDC